MQLKFMKLGGNKRLEELLNLFEVPKTTQKEVLYSSKLLEYHRGCLKAEITQGKSPQMPSAEEALSPSSVEITNKDKGNYGSVQNSTSGTDDFSESKKQYSSHDTNSSSSNQGYLSYFGSYVSSAYQKGKDVAYNVKEKVKDSDLTKKIQNAGNKTVEVIGNTGHKIKETGVNVVHAAKDTAGNIVAKGGEIYGKVKEKGSELASSETAQNIKSKVSENINYYSEKIWGHQEEKEEKKRRRTSGKYQPI